MRFFTPRKAHELTARDADWTDVFEIDDRPAKRVINADELERETILAALDEVEGSDDYLKMHAEMLANMHAYVLHLVDGWADSEISERLGVDEREVPFMRARFHYWSAVAVFRLCRHHGFSMGELGARAAAGWGTPLGYTS